MKTSLFEVSTLIPKPIGEVFAFFSNAQNLQALTPPWVHFKILTPPPIEMKTGALIDYRIRVHGIPFRWRTRINSWNPPHQFVDEQLRGPYSVWIHEHTFLPRGNKTEMTDRVQYRAPGGPWIETLFVRKDIKRIFEFRSRRISEIFV